MGRPRHPPGVANRSLFGNGTALHGPLDGARMLFATNYRLLEALKEDPLLRRYAVVIVDEVHERSMEMDLILGLLKSTLARPGLRSTRGRVCPQGSWEWRFY